MSGPIKPKEVQAQKDAELPEEVFEVFNALIKKNWGDSMARIYQEEAVLGVASSMGIMRREVFEKGLLDIESAYRNAGWKVEYDKPGYNETYEPFWIFRK